MTNTNGFSDSQESVLFGDEVFDVLKEEIGYPIPLNPEDLEEQPEEKYDIGADRQYPGKGKRVREDNQDGYFDAGALDPIKEEFAGHLNFQLLINNEKANKQCTINSAS
ncbi:hypothetical protein KM043_006806 [Ampulex compressa]|nr:hypothetical protein KM043_006806 [Ampulex compressa]